MNADKPRFECVQLAIHQFQKIPGWKDADDLLKDCIYFKGVHFMAIANYRSAIITFEAIPGMKDVDDRVKDCIYAVGIENMTNQHYKSAIKEFEKIHGWKDADAKIKECKVAGIKVDNTWVWCLATVPIAAQILLRFLGLTNFWLSLITVILNTIFFLLDKKELESIEDGPDGWMWLGLVLVPIYLFMRASKVDKKYGYAITWCALFAANFAIIILINVLRGLILNALHGLGLI